MNNDLNKNQSRPAVGKSALAREPSRPVAASARLGRPQDAQKSYERYLALARATALTGDQIEAENYYQHAEHYFRSMAAGAN